MHLVIHTFLAILIIKLSDWCLHHKFGLGYWLHTNTLATIVTAFLTLDFFGGWLVHIAQHKALFYGGFILSIMPIIMWILLPACAIARWKAC